MGVDLNLARRRLEFHFMGIISWLINYTGKTDLVKMAGEEPCCLQAVYSFCYTGDVDDVCDY